MGSKKIRIGLVGYGYWGPNLARNASQNPLVKLVSIADVDAQRRRIAAADFSTISDVRILKDDSDVTDDPGIDAVMIATPLTSHYRIAKHALENGKHVLLEKPMTKSAREARELIKIAKRNKRVLLVDHTFVYLGAVKKIKEIIESKKLGEIYYYDSVRINLGLFRSDVNVVWDLAPHDLSILQHVINKKPKSVSAVGERFAKSPHEAIAYITLKLEGGTLVHLHVNWLSPVKIRKTVIGGNRRILVFDDLEPSEKIKIYDHGVSLDSSTKEKSYRDLVKYRIGDIYSPYVDRQEALKIEIQHFCDCITKGIKPITGGESGLQIVKILEAADRSIQSGGKQVRI